MRTRVGVSGSYPAPVDRFARKSVFWVDPSLPYFEFLGIPTLESPLPLLTLRGVSNAYDVESTLADPVLRLFAADGEMSITRMNDLVVSTPAWVDDNLVDILAESQDSGDEDDAQPASTLNDLALLDLM